MRSTARRKPLGGRYQRNEGERDDGDDDEDPPGRPEGVDVLVALAVQNRDEAGPPLVADLLEEPADVCALVGRAEQVDEADQEAAGEEDADEREDGPHRHPLAEQHPGEQRERRGRREGPAEVLTPDRGRDDDDRDRHDRDRDVDAPPVAERHASRPARIAATLAVSWADARLPRPAKRIPTVGEYPNTALNSRWVPVTASTACAAASRASRGDERVERVAAAEQPANECERQGHSADERPVRGGAAAVGEVDPRRGEGRGGNPMTTSAAHCRKVRHRRSQINMTAASMNRERDRDDGVGGDVDEVVAEQPVGARVVEERDTVGERSAVAGHLHRPALHVLGPVHAEDVQHGRRDVDEADEAGARRVVPDFMSPGS